MNILILGHKEHGKGTFTKMCREVWGIPGISSSEFSLHNIIFPSLSLKYGYKTIEECLADKDDKRPDWFNEISNFNKPNGTALACSLLEKHNAYDGMRNDFEFNACMEAKLFDFIFWIDGSKRKPLESKKSMKIEYDPNIMIPVDNNGPESDMLRFVESSLILRLTSISLALK